jgi:hypothetical protein
MERRLALGASAMNTAMPIRQLRLMDLALRVDHHVSSSRTVINLGMPA